MGISAKIKGVVAISGKGTAGLADALNVGSAQALANKFYRSSFSATDLVMIADYVGASLAFCFPDGSRITIDADDIKPETNRP